MARKAFWAVLIATAAGVSSTAAQSPKWNYAALTTSVDTFAFRDRTGTYGVRVTRIERVDSGFVFTETTRQRAWIDTTVVHLNSDLSVRRVRQDGWLVGSRSWVDVHVENGRATGIVNNGTKEHRVNVRVPDGAIEEYVLMAVLPAMSWHEDAQFILPVLSSSRSEVREYTFRVSATEDLALPTGTIPAFRVDVTGLSTLVIHVSKEAPHRLLRIEPVGLNMEIVRIGGK